MTEQSLAGASDPVAALTEASKTLKNRRNATGLSVEDVAGALRVKTHYIESIDSGDWNSLSHLYIIGYVRSYAALLSLPDEEIVAAVKAWQAGDKRFDLIIRDSGKEEARKEHIAHSKSIPKASGALFVVPLLLGLCYFAYTEFTAPEKVSIASTLPEVNQESTQNSIENVIDAPTQSNVATAHHIDPQEPSNYIIHAGESAALKVFDHDDRLQDEMRLTPGEAYFLTLPQGGYVKATGNAALVDVYTDDMGKKLGNIGMLYSRRR